MRLVSICILVVVAFAPALSAQVYLTGALMYEANTNGTNVGGSWEFDTFSTPNTGNAKFNINGSTDLAIALSPGGNALSLSGGSLTNYSGLGLFFSTSATPFSGPFDAIPNLVVVDGVASSTSFSFATGGATVATYGQYSLDLGYSGATTYQLGGYNVTVTGFDYGGPGNNLQLSVTAIPEPMISSIAAGVVALGLALGRRRNWFLHWRRK